MAVLEDELRFRTVGELFSDFGDRLRIPTFQRPYQWGPQQVRDLVDDIVAAVEHGQAEGYVLGTVILLQDREGPGEATMQFVDGQQRLLTLTMLRGLLDGTWSCPMGETESAVSMALAVLTKRIPKSGADRERMKAHLDEHCTLLTVITNDEDEAFQFFDSQNLRGKALRPHDLLKAYHLREMAGSADLRQAEVVERWQSIRERLLDDLFSRVLYRIDRWSRGRPAPGFTTEEIDSFKGVSVRDQTPSARYHLAAQLSYHALDSSSEGDADFTSTVELDRLRARFQLGAPVAAGESFFEFVAFQHEEVRRIEEELFGERGLLDKKYGNHPRYLYCRDLLICSLLYFRNVFGGDDRVEVKEALARYSYSPRMEFQRVGWQTIDNYALLGGTDRLANVNRGNLFMEIRHARTKRDVKIQDLALATLRDNGPNENDERLRDRLLNNGGRQ